MGAGCGRALRRFSSRALTCGWRAAGLCARGFPPAFRGARQFMVRFRPFCEILMLFGMAQFARPLHSDLMVRDLLHVFAPQTLGHQMPAFHPIARMKLAVGEKFARANVVERISTIVAAPKMVASHEDKCTETQAEINPFDYKAAMPVKAQAYAEFHVPRQGRPSQTTRAFAPGHP